MNHPFGLSVQAPSPKEGVPVSAGRHCHTVFASQGRLAGGLPVLPRRGLRPGTAPEE